METEIQEQDQGQPIETQKKNAFYVQADALAIGMANGAAPFLPVFMARLGASSTQVGLLTTMPGITGLLISLPVGRFLQSRRNIVPWFSTARMLYLSAYALTGLLPFFLPAKYQLIGILAIWAIMTLPQVMLNVSFSVVMNAVAGPRGRYELMSKRWSIIGITTAFTVAIVGQVLENFPFPINYQMVFIVLSLGGVLSYFFTTRIRLPDADPVPLDGGSGTPWQNIQNYQRLLREQPAFTAFVLKRFVYMFGFTLALPLFPLYYVRQLHASDAWIGFISTAQTAVMLIGYFSWARLSRKYGSRFVLLGTTLGVSIYPVLVAMTQRVELIALYAGLAGMFQAGIDLVFFDELMKTVPPRYSATFVALAQSMQHLALILAPLTGTFLADQFGIGVGLLVSAVIRFSGFALFLLGSIPKQKADLAADTSG